MLSSQYYANIKSHLYSFGAKAAYNFDLTNKLSLRPSLLVDYTFAKTLSYSVISTGTTNINKNMHRFDLVLELSFNGNLDNGKLTSLQIIIRDLVQKELIHSEEQNIKI